LLLIDNYNEVPVVFNNFDIVGDFTITPSAVPLARHIAIAGACIRVSMLGVASVFSPP
jgi:hypothetical protein